MRRPPGRRAETGHGVERPAVHRPVNSPRLPRADTLRARPRRTARRPAAHAGAAQAVERLIASYRGTTPTDAPVLRDRADVAAYAAYRMPATFEAVRVGAGRVRGRRARAGRPAAMWTSAAAPARRPGRSPPPGTGARARDGPRLGRARARPRPGARRPRTPRCAVPRGGAPVSERRSPSTSTDLVTVSYVLGELDRGRPRPSVVDAAASRRPGRRGRRAGHPRRLRPDHRGPRPADRRRLPRRRPLPAQRGLPHRARRRTGATSPPGSAAPRCTARSRAAPCRTRTRSSATWPPPASPPSARAGPRHPQAADPQGPGAPGPVRARTGALRRDDGHQAARRRCTGRPATPTGATPGRRPHRGARGW